MSVAELDVLLGRWAVTGRSRKADHDDVRGELTVTPLLGGRMLQLLGWIAVEDHRVESLELIWRDGSGPGFAAHVHDGSGEPLDYRWDIDGDTVTHAGLGMTYTGAISADRDTIDGSWEPDPDRPDMAPMAYHATMRRTG